MNVFRLFLFTFFVTLAFPVISGQTALAEDSVDPMVQGIINLGNDMRPEAKEITTVQEPLPDLEAEFRMKQEEHHFILGICIVLLTAVVLLMELVILKRSHACTAENVVNGTGLVLIIQATILVVLLSPTTEQLTAAIGVLGAIAGYLFGSARRGTSGAANQQTRQETTAPPAAPPTE
jgi:hypothetical protein